MSKYQKKRENGITAIMVIITILLFLFVLLLALPNIYLDNQIYYESRKISKYQNIVWRLKDEQSIIKRRLEHIRYQDEILSQDNYVGDEN